jgi:hypothetical protein
MFRMYRYFVEDKIDTGNGRATKPRIEDKCRWKFIPSSILLDTATFSCVGRSSFISVHPVLPVISYSFDIRAPHFDKYLDHGGLPLLFCFGVALDMPPSISPCRNHSIGAMFLNLYFRIVPCCGLPTIPTHDCLLSPCMSVPVVTFQLSSRSPDQVDPSYSFSR